MSVFLFSILTLLIIKHRFFWKAEKTNLFPDGFKYMSHRGLKKKFPENTLKSIEEAQNSGFEWVELDLMTTKDSVVVCSHNFDLESETNGQGYIYNRSYDEIKFLSTGVRSHPTNTQRIPSFQKIVDNFSNNLKYNLEIKTKSIFDLGTVRALVRILKKNKLRFFLISSFNPLVILYLKIFCKNIKTAFLVEGYKFLWIINWIHPNYLNPRADMVNEDLISHSKKHNYGLIVWTVNSDMGLNFCINKKVQSVITDRSLNI